MPTYKPHPKQQQLLLCVQETIALSQHIATALHERYAPAEASRRIRLYMEQFAPIAKLLQEDAGKQCRSRKKQQP